MQTRGEGWEKREEEAFLLLPSHPQEYRGAQDIHLGEHVQTQGLYQGLLGHRES